MKVKKLTKEEVTTATEEQKRKTTAEQTEDEDHWLPQAVIQGLKNTSKPESSREEIARKRVDRRKFKVSFLCCNYLPYIWVIIWTIFGFSLFSIS
jgi:hypothetical protein